MKFLLFPLLFILMLNASAQELSYARDVVDTLASAHMKGRGYVQKGDRTAAEFISSEFKRFGLESFKRDYFQPFTMPVNTFPGAMLLIINGDTLAPGEDFLVEAGSPSLSGTFGTFEVSANDLLKEENLRENLHLLKDRFLIVNGLNSLSRSQQSELQEVLDFLKYHPRSPIAGMIQLTDKKLTWAPAPVQFAKPSIIVRSESVGETISQVILEVEAKFIEGYKTQNVVGYVEGKKADSLIVLTAHYDHLGMMGSETIFPGANDNASGVAMLLSLAKHFAQNTPEYTTVFIAFAAEEIGLIGSKHFVENPLFDLDRIRFLINFDLAGTGDDGIQVVNGSVHKDKFETLTRINEEHDLLPQVKIRGEACNSDHCFFHQHGVPSFFIYTLGGIQAYHDVFDRADTLPLTEFEDYFRLITSFIETL